MPHVFCPRCVSLVSYRCQCVNLVPNVSPTAKITLTLSMAGYLGRVCAIVGCVCFADNVYETHYTQSGLADVRRDSATMPNTPFSVDANRRSDGISSISPLTSTSPSFPEHKGSVSSQPAFRELLALAKSKDEISQGVANSGDGQYVSEVRARRTFEGPSPSKRFNVSASLRWNPSAFAISRGESYEIKVKDSLFWYDGFIKTNAQGYEAHYDALSQCWVAVGLCRPYLKGQRARLSSARWFELVCAIGEYVWKLQEAEKGVRYLPLREDLVSQTLFAVGNFVQFTANHTGELICFANDADSLYWNNRGLIEVTVRRTSWPPTPVTDYGLLLD